MEKYKPNETEIKGELKNQVANFIQCSLDINQETKSKMIKDLGSNWNDERFDVEKLTHYATRFSISAWKEQNFKIVQLWKDIVIKNASNSNTPHLVANEVISEMKSKFNINDED